jgi:hypothetical protein
MQMVATRSKSHVLPQETALALRTSLLVVQFSYDQKANSLNVRAIVNMVIAEHGERNFHRKTRVIVLKNEFTL